MTIEPTGEELARIKKHIKRANREFEEISPIIQAKKYKEPYKEEGKLGTTDGIERVNIWDVKREYRKLYLKKIK